MENISNWEISPDKCTRCPSCGKTSWYIMKCDCGNIFCRHCSAEKSDSDTIVLKCPECKKIELYV